MLDFKQDQKKASSSRILDIEEEFELEESEEEEIEKINGQAISLNGNDDIDLNEY